MNPPKAYRVRPGKLESFSRCIACDRFTPSNMIFHHEGTHWILCRIDYADYWENTDELSSDYKEYP
jgi:hypothetical protein